MKLLNLNEGFFPIKLEFELDEINIPKIGNLIDKIKVNIQISKVSSEILTSKGEIKCKFEDSCQNCLEKTSVLIERDVNVVLKDIKELNSDNASDDQIHYQDLENFDLQNFLEEEIAISYPDIVKCNTDCYEDKTPYKKEKNLPFKKIRDLIG